MICLKRKTNHQYYNCKIEDEEMACDECCTCCYSGEICDQCRTIFDLWDDDNNLIYHGYNKLFVESLARTYEEIDKIIANKIYYTINKNDEGKCFIEKKHLLKKEDFKYGNLRILIDSLIFSSEEAANNRASIINRLIDLNGGKRDDK